MKTLQVFLSILVLIAGIALLSTCSEPEKPKPEITSISPAEGPIGTPVTIKGKNFPSFESLQFGSVSTTSIASKTDTEIVTVVPPGLSPGDVSVTVKTGGGNSNAVAFKVLPSEPEITSIEPAKGSVGMEVIIKGKYLATATSASFGTSAVSTFVSKSDTEVKLQVPAGLSPGALDVTITTAGGVSNKSTFTVVGKPTITSITPAIGPTGRVVSIAGTFFEDASKVSFGAGDAMTFSIKNANLIEATVPTNATTGKVKVVTPGGEALSAVDFVVKGAPEISGFTPSSGIVGTVVTITGQNFDAGSVVVKFGTGTATEVTIVSATQITAKVPATGTTGKITIETAAGSGLSASNFTVIGAPAISSFTPTSGLAGVEVTITGTNFINVNTIKFNSTVVTAGNYTLFSDTQIKAKVPAGAASGKISVTTPAGSGTSGTDFTVLLPPVITSFSPANGAQGSNVIITGTGFTNITSVKFNEVEAGAGNFTVNSATQITAKVPASATSGKIKVTNALGVATSANTFYVTPFISTISPTSGSAGTTVTITGTNLESATVKFGATSVTPATNTGTTITVLVPNGISGALNITVVNSGGTSNAKTFTVTDPVVVDEIVATANIVEQLLLLKGTNLLGATKVLFGNVEADVLTNTSKVVTTLIPASLGVGTYTVKVVTSNGTSNGKTFEVLNVQNPNTGGVSMVNGASVVSLPAGYVPPVSNQWGNTFNPDERFFLFEDNGVLNVEFSVNFAVVDVGTGSYDLANNYIEFTVNGVRYVGVWEPRTTGVDSFGDPICFANMTLISTESGKQLELAVQIFDNCP